MRSNEVARMAGVSVRTLRHYHALGLLPEPPRAANGYRDYAPADVARVLRIRRLASLGFPLARVGAVMEEMDAGAEAADDPLAELDRELEQEISRLEAQRRTIAALRAERLRPDLPPPFARAVRLLAGDAALESLTEEDRAALLIAGHVYGDADVAELERVGAALADAQVARAVEALDARMGRLAPDAPEWERAALAADALEALGPVIACFDPANWLRPATEGERLLEEADSAGLNEAQRDVAARIERAIEDALRERAG
ncbi:MerR family transcriptional regulator [Adlercreutzia faecimuris]|uniref:MerR family transcriptional regulator n=1 Tax=Adlercreutzia faecimuris TaxID=2897341 RepID=A0ABS9WHA2_9ACTN|nr:MerR family transcriptional regulator [Adlercreutzia sp. JBNU-10]MCI2241862.1 MerR family transcriptional regulator [Adlercreutzia sp. JBNU-10]